MKVMYGNVPVTNLHVVKHDVSTDDATVIPTDLQAGVTCYARGQKITGTGKSFEFAFYGGWSTNSPLYVPSDINVIEIASTEYPIQLSIAMSNMKDCDFSISQTIGNIFMDSVSYPVNVQVANNIMTISCDKTVTLQLFYGKDNYI